MNCSWVIVPKPVIPFTTNHHSLQLLIGLIYDPTHLRSENSGSECTHYPSGTRHRPLLLHDRYTLPWWVTNLQTGIVLAELRGLDRKVSSLHIELAIRLRWLTDWIAHKQWSWLCELWSQKPSIACSDQKKWIVLLERWTLICCVIEGAKPRKCSTLLHVESS